MLIIDIFLRIYAGTVIYLAARVFWEAQTPFITWLSASVIGVIVLTEYVNLRSDWERRREAEQREVRHQEFMRRLDEAIRNDEERGG